ncbi:MAG: glycosyltransferase [Gaiellales bacterium]|nr:MAG: glycosyltransferase [Gaiellales bacterium]
MRIAVIGTKGVPARFGGIERHCDELYPRLADRGHDVTIFVRGWYSPVRGPYLGLNLRAAPTINAKGMDAFIHTGAASLAALGGGFDIIHYHGIGPSLFSFLPRLSRARIVATVHALDWQRDKWGSGARSILKAGERASAVFPHRTIVVSRELKRYFRERYGRDTVYIPNGVDFVSRPRASRLVRDLGLEPGGYILYLGRLVPEKGCHDLIEAYQSSGLDAPLVVAGGSSHSDDYVDMLHSMAAGNQRIIFTGNVEGELLSQLSAHAGLFVLPSYLEGLPIVVLEMLWYKVPVLASDIGPAREALREGEFGRLYSTGDVADLAEKLAGAYGEREAMRRQAEAGHEHVKVENDWDRIAEQTEEVYRDITGP